MISLLDLIAMRVRADDFRRGVKGSEKFLEENAANDIDALLDENSDLRKMVSDYATQVGQYERAAQEIIRKEEYFQEGKWDGAASMGSAKFILSADRRSRPFEEEPESICGDYPAPCNCDDPINHGGHR